jgi:hypothetical protein
VEPGLVSVRGGLFEDGAEGAFLEESSGAGVREATCPDDEQAKPNRIVKTAAALQIWFIIREFVNFQQSGTDVASSVP